MFLLKVFRYDPYLEEQVIETYAVSRDKTELGLYALGWIDATVVPEDHYYEISPVKEVV